MSEMDEVSFRSAEGADVPALMALAEECPGAPRWTLATWRQVLDSAGGRARRTVVVAESDERFVGFGVIGIAGDAAEIESLAVSPVARRQGIGRSLCEALMRWARLSGASRALLEVRVSNQAARALYESLHFREVAIRRGYYREPDEDGVMMAREL